MLFAYAAVGVKLNPPAPVTETVAGVIAEPVYVKDKPVMVTTVVEAAFPMVKSLLSLEASWLASPKYE